MSAFRSAGLAVLAVVVFPAIALAADPSPTAGGGAGDPRSSGQGPGLVGDPGLAIAVVVVVGLAALLLTLAYVRLTAREAGHDDH
jgi:hypothetical protein